MLIQSIQYAGISLLVPETNKSFIMGSRVLTIWVNHISLLMYKSLIPSDLKVSTEKTLLVRDWLKNLYEGKYITHIPGKHSEHIYTYK